MNTFMMIAVIVAALYIGWKTFKKDDDEDTPTLSPTPSPTPSNSVDELSASITDSSACNHEPMKVYNDDLCSGGTYPGFSDNVNLYPEQNITVTGGVAPYIYSVVSGTENWTTISLIGTQIKSLTVNGAEIILEYGDNGLNPDDITVEGNVTSTVRVTDANGTTTDVPNVSCYVNIQRTCNDIQ